MGLITSFLIGLSEILNPGKGEPDNLNSYNDDFNDDYDDYYEQVHEDAICGDIEAIVEMKEEFGDDWEEEF